MDKIITCPNCDELIIIHELNCCIFRHGSIKETGEQIDPHLSKEICEELVKTDKIYGCGKPFKIIVLENGSWNIEKCDYI
jgi:hypothetical protein